MSAPYPDHNEFGERLAHDGSIGPTRLEAERDAQYDRDEHVAWMDGDASDE